MRPQAPKNQRRIHWNTSRIFRGREQRRCLVIICRSRMVNVGQVPSLKKLRHHRLAFFAYPLSGGFEHISLGRIESIPCLAYSSEAAASATKVGS